MIRKITVVSLIIASSTLLQAGPPAKGSSKSSSSSSGNGRIARGAHLVVMAGCHDCHSPKSNPAIMEPDAARLLSGRPSTTAAPQKPAPGEISASGDLTAWYGPWGISYSANLTPDEDTGMGKRYDEASFIRTLRTGKKPEGEPLLPPMPWPNYAKMSDADLKAIYAYLRSLPPVKNNVRLAVAPAAAPSR